MYVLNKSLFNTEVLSDEFKLIMKLLHLIYQFNVTRTQQMFITFFVMILLQELNQSLVHAHSCNSYILHQPSYTKAYILPTGYPGEHTQLDLFFCQESELKANLEVELGLLFEFCLTSARKTPNKTVIQNWYKCFFNSHPRNQSVSNKKYKE